MVGPYLATAPGAAGLAAAGQPRCPKPWGYGGGWAAVSGRRKGWTCLWRGLARRRSWDLREGAKSKDESAIRQGRSEMAAASEQGRCTSGLVPRVKGGKRTTARRSTGR